MKLDRVIVDRSRRRTMEPGYFYPRLLIFLLLGIIVSLLLIIYLKYRQDEHYREEIRRLDDVSHQLDRHSAALVRQQCLLKAAELQFYVDCYVEQRLRLGTELSRPTAASPALPIPFRPSTALPRGQWQRLSCLK